MSSMRKTLSLILIVLGSLLMVTAASAEQPAQDHKVTICHRTNSNTNPYVQITVDEHAVDGVGQKGPADHYGEHQGPIWNNTLKAQHIEWGDIIPPVAGFHNGLNWTEAGQKIFRDGCKVEGETTTTTVDETTTTTVDETTTTTEAPTTTTTLEETTTTLGTDGSTTVPNTPTVPKSPKPVIGPASVPAELPATGNETLYLGALGVILLLAGTGLAVRYR